MFDGIIRAMRAATTYAILPGYADLDVPVFRHNSPPFGSSKRTVALDRREAAKKRAKRRAKRFGHG